MANHETEVDPWVDERLAVLAEPEHWTPNTARALAGWRKRIGAPRRERPRWLLWALPLTLASLAIVLLPAARACAQRPGACAQSLWASVAHPEAVNFKQIGPANAPVTLEIFIDYQCPPCAVFSRDVIPRLEAQYLQNGELKLVFHDLPLPHHRYAKLAARYVDAAGQLGYYRLAAKQIFETHNAWSVTGDVDSELAKVLSPGVMSQLRRLVEQDAQLDRTIETDIAAATREGIAKTPSAVLVFKGKRQTIPGTLSFDEIKRYIDEVQQ
jgi:protein-disulfide isomerase